MDLIVNSIIDSNIFSDFHEFDHEFIDSIRDEVRAMLDKISTDEGKHYLVQMEIGNNFRNKLLYRGIIFVLKFLAH